jgi:hypothetical protein
MRFFDPDCVYWPIETDNGIDAAVRAQCGLTNWLAISPLDDSGGGELSEAIEASRSLACEKLLPMH